MSQSLWLILPFFALGVGLGKGGLGSAFAGVLTPLLSIFIPVKEAIALTLPFFIMGDAGALWFYWQKWDMDEIRRLIAPAVLGVLAGSYLLAHLPTETLRLILGLLSLTIVSYKLAESRLKRLQYRPQPWHTLLAGFSAGIAAAVASAGGTIFTAYLLLKKMPPLPFLGTTTFFFIVINLTRLPGLFSAGVLTWDIFRQIILFLPLVWLGVWLGRIFIRYIDPVSFDRLMTLILGVAGVLLIVR